ncbi:MAG: carbamoyltransferase HypF [Butyrivibrio sp.]|nr:carbamoyltransferase HypF [Butyrivibrio sp.]
MRQILHVIGAVQGVGYRPFVLKKATEYGIGGYVKNLGASVEILAIGIKADVLSFVEVLRNEAPEGAIVLDVKCECIDDKVDTDSNNGSSFEIIESSKVDFQDLPIFLPDIGICDECLKEMLDTRDRRYRYPLISCASCGPRISILNRLPYDRETTTMDEFKMCPKCDREYHYGRRTYAQTISCHDCGPQMLFEYFSGTKIIYKEKDSAVNDAAKLLLDNKVIGLKGISGYQLIGRPIDLVAKKIRNIKGREKKPFAVMFSDIESIREYCFCNNEEEKLLKSSPRPIVLLEKKKDLDYGVCKDSRYIGAFLPSSGIHRLLTDAVGPLIVTSANISDEPIEISDDSFRTKFLDENKAEGMLYHKRKINVPQDDSVAFVTKISDDTFKTSYIRRSRGYVPLPVLLHKIGESKFSVLALGGDLKNTFSFGKHERIIPSPYIGDLKDYSTLINQKEIYKRFSEMYSFTPDLVVCDMHPLYQSRRIAEDVVKEKNIPLLEVQHHHAHILSVMAEKSLDSCIGIAFDGTGYGTDGNIWGGEILYCNRDSFERKGHLSYVKLCGGDIAPKNARQVKECYEYALSKEVPNIVKAALDNNIGTYLTSSVGRLFDAISSLLDIKHENSFEGECATSLEKYAWDYLSLNIVDNNVPKLDINIDICEGQYIINQIKLFDDILKLKVSQIYSTKVISLAFHYFLADCILKVCELIRKEIGETKVCLSGGVFANRLLLQNAIKKLSDNGFEVYTNEIVPAGDAGISLGQAYYGLLHDV